MNSAVYCRDYIPQWLNIRHNPQSLDSLRTLMGNEWWMSHGIPRLSFIQQKKLQTHLLTTSLSSVATVAETLQNFVLPFNDIISALIYSAVNVTNLCWYPFGFYILNIDKMQGEISDNYWVNNVCTEEFCSGRRSVWWSVYQSPIIKAQTVYG